MTVKEFTLEMPRSVLFGAGTRERLPELLEPLGKRVLLLSGRTWLARSGWRDRFLDLLRGFDTLLLECPPGEPEVASLNELLARARDFAPQAIVAVGGGSVLDTGKAVSGLLRVRDRVEDFLEGVGRDLTLPGPGVPWLAVPTTAGTGAEATKNAVIRSAALGAKKSLRSPYLLATHALVDPELAVGSPLALSGASGMDALTQLIESFVSRKARPVPRALILQAFPIMLDSLRRIPRDPANLEARTSAAYGALCSGIALANSGLGAAHGFASGLGGLYDIPHGLICALFMRPVLEINAPAICDDCARLKQAARSCAAGELSGQEGLDPVEWLIREIDLLFPLYELQENLKGFGIDEAAVAEIARRSSGSSMSGNPRQLSQEERERIIKGLL